VRSLLDAAENVLKAQSNAPDKLRALTLEFMKLYVGAASRQRVLLNDLNHLPKARRTTIVGIQRQLVEIVEGLLADIRAELGARAALRWPTAMLYFGMINWTHTWMDSSGPVTPEKIATLAANIFLEGLNTSEIPKA
jgi:hypothetical protein